MKRISLNQQSNMGLSSICLVFVFACTTLFSIQTKAQAKKPWPVPSSASQLKSSVTSDANVLREAKKNYSTFCSPCHGNSGKGDGMAAASLNPRPADHTSDLVQNESDGSLFWKLSEGRNPMPTYKQILTESQRWGLIAYIRTLKRK